MSCVSPHVIITVPHHLCPPGVNSTAPEHWCDFGAQYAAMALYDRLVRILGPDQVELFLGNVPRTECDLNRQVCRDTPFRKQLQTRLDKALASKTILLDFHSFPHPESWKDAMLLDQDLVLLYSGPERRNSALALARVLEQGNNHKLRVAVAQGDDNDIINSAVAQGIREAHLVEVGEFLSLRKLEAIIQRLESWMSCPQK